MFNQHKFPEPRTVGRYCLMYECKKGQEMKFKWLYRKEQLTVDLKRSIL